MLCCARPMVDEVNSCKRQPEWVVVGYQVKADTNEPVVLVLTCCERHRVAVEKYQCTPVDPALCLGIEHLDLVVEELMLTGEVYVGAAVPA